MIPKKPADVTWTDEQWEAIYDDNKNIIVSAGAGSGKTAVLTERVIRKLKDGVNVNELLILTFTKAAAGEMADRIRKKIKKIPELKEQLNLLDSSYITTFDSFALSIVKRYHYLLNVSPNIGIIDSNVIELKKNEIMDELFLEYYEQQHLLFLKMIKTFCTKDDTDIRNYVLNISNKLDLLFSSLINNLVYVLSIWTLGISIIGLPIIITIFSFKFFFFGFSLSSIICTYKWGGILRSLVHLFPHQLLFLIVLLLVTFYAVSFCLKLFNYLFFKKMINFREVMRKYLKILLICSLTTIFISLYEVYISTYLLNLFN